MKYTQKLTALILFIYLVTGCTNNQSGHLNDVLLRGKEQQYWDLIITQSSYSGITVEVNIKKKTPMYSLLFKQDGSLTHLYNHNATTSTNFNNITDVHINPDNWKVYEDTISFQNPEASYTGEKMTV